MEAMLMQILSGTYICQSPIRTKKTVRKFVRTGHYIRHHHSSSDHKICPTATVLFIVYWHKSKQVAIRPITERWCYKLLLCRLKTTTRLINPEKVFLLSTATSLLKDNLFLAILFTKPMTFKKKLVVSLMKKFVSTSPGDWWSDLCNSPMCLT